MARAAGAVLRERALVDASVPLRGRQHVRLARQPGRREERAVRRLRRVRERGGSGGRGSPSRPRQPGTSPARVAARGRARGSPRARGSVARAGGTASSSAPRRRSSPPAPRVRRSESRSSAAAPRRGPRTAAFRAGGRHRQVDPQRVEQPQPDRAGEQREQAPERRARDAFERLLVVRVPPDGGVEARWLSANETPMRPVRCSTRRSSSPEGEARAPRVARLEERLGLGRADRLDARGGEQRRGAAVQERLSRRDDDDHVRLDERRVDPHARRELHQLGVLDVVDDDAPVKRRAKPEVTRPPVSRASTRRARPPATSSVCWSRGIPACSSSAEAASIARRRGSSSVGIG